MKNPPAHVKGGGATGNEGIKLARLDPDHPAVSPSNQQPRTPRAEAARSLSQSDLGILQFADFIVVELAEFQRTSKPRMRR